MATTNPSESEAPTSVTSRGKDATASEATSEATSRESRVRVAPTLPLVVCAVLLSFYALYFARSLFVPVTTAMFAYLTLRPLVRHSRRIGIPRVISATVIMLTIAVSCAVGTFAVAEPARQMIERLPAKVDVAKDRLSFVFEKMEAFNKAADDMAAPAEDKANFTEEKPIPVEVKQPAWSSNLSLVSGTGNLISFILIAGVLLYFLLAYGDDVLRSVMQVLPNLTARKQLVGTVERVQEGLGSYLAQVTLINAALGIAVGTAMWLFGMPAPIMWGVMAAAFNFVPILGAICGAGVILLFALVNFESTTMAFLVAGTFVSLTTLEGHFITPSILGRSLEISPVVVFLSIVVWGWLWGLMGVFLSVPILIAVRLACEHHETLKPLALILGSPGAKAAHAQYAEADDNASDQNASKPNANASDAHPAKEPSANPHRPQTRPAAAAP